jgi:hypothetical protein
MISGAGSPDTYTPIRHGMEKPAAVRGPEMPQPVAKPLPATCFMMLGQ